METYLKLKETYSRSVDRLTKKDKQISTLRLILVLSIGSLIYVYFHESHSLILVSVVMVLICFFIILKSHQKLRWKKRLSQAKKQVATEEIKAIDGDYSSFQSGKEFIDTHHPFSYDLDVFGDHSLFQFLNRTETYRGRQILADSLQKILSPSEILANQQSVQELAEMPDWRIELRALAQLEPDSEASYNDLKEWSDRTILKESRLLNVLSYGLPLATLACIILSLVSSIEIVGKLSWLGILANLSILGIYAKKIQHELISSTKIERILRQYAYILLHIESAAFKCKRTQQLASQLTQPSQASQGLSELSRLFGRMEHVTNIFASPLLNGLFLYHVHTLRQLSRWRSIHGTRVMQWLDVIGEFEKLSSLAGFSYNHPDFAFPSINETHHFSFENLGHPLLHKQKAVTNTISFNEARFFILTGSNMSGKSTFLRTIGVNMILGSIGAPVFASQASIHPMHVYVSMRLSDSLSDSESYFYAEVKRLKEIIDALQQQPCFVLLDEILRGTNSDDKQNGTIEVIKKMANLKAYGGIATHDLEVCKIADQYPAILVNKRFEVEIVNNELVFDYKLEDGVCQNKSATFIMKKMGVI